METETLTDKNVLDAVGSLPFQTSEDWAEFFEKFGANGRTYSDLTALTPKSMEAIYMVGFNLYNGGKYEDAERIFQLLAMLNHFEKKYWKALAASRENQRKFDTAVQAYGFLGMMDVFDPYPPLQAGKCLVSMGKAEEAKAAFRAAFYNSQDKPELAAIHQEATALLEALEKAGAQETSNGEKSNG